MALAVTATIGVRGRIVRRLAARIGASARSRPSRHVDVGEHAA
jgi:hypothetical protein